MMLLWSEFRPFFLVKSYLSGHICERDFLGNIYIPQEVELLPEDISIALKSAVVWIYSTSGAFDLRAS